MKFCSRSSAWLKGVLAHDVAGLLGPRQEVGDVAGQPHVAVGRTPDAEGAGAILHLEHARDGAVDALAQQRVGGEAHALGHVVDVEQRQGAAGRLLGAAVGVAVERGEDARHVERGGGPDRDGRPCERRGIRSWKRSLGER